MRRVLITVAMILTFSFTANLVGPLSSTTQAAPGPGEKINATCDTSTLLTFPPWYKGLAGGKSADDCDIVEKDLRTLVVRIIINITEIILQLVGYASAVFIIIGGYHYLLSSGDPSKMTAAKNTILNAVIGLVISLFSVAIVNVVAGAL